MPRQETFGGNSDRDPDFSPPRSQFFIRKEYQNYSTANVSPKDKRYRPAFDNSMVKKVDSSQTRQPRTHTNKENIQKSLQIERIYRSKSKKSQNKSKPSFQI